MILLSLVAPKSPQDGLKFGQDGPKIGPRQLQDLPKTSLKIFFWHPLFRLRFCFVLGPTWASFDSLLCASWGSGGASGRLTFPLISWVCACRPLKGFQGGSPNFPHGFPGGSPNFSNGFPGGSPNFSKAYKGVA